MFLQDAGSSEVDLTCRHRKSSSRPHALRGLELLRLTVRNSYQGSGAPPRPTLDLQRTAQPLGALTHRLQPEVARERSRRIEADPVVSNLQHDTFGLLLQQQPHVLGPGVLDGIV